MKGLYFLFPGPVKLWAGLLAVVFIAMSTLHGCTCRGCGGCHGCTTSVVIDKESRRIRADDVRMRLTANKNRVTNRKLRYSQLFYIDKTVWFTIDYSLKLKKRPPVNHICEHEVEENQDMEKSLDRFQILFSPDKKHFAVGLDQKVYEFFHLFEEGVPFSSGCYYLNDSNFSYLQTADLTLNQIDWKRFPEPARLFDLIIVPNTYSVWTLPDNMSNVLELLSQMPPGNQHEMVLIENWYNEVAFSHFDSARVGKIIRVSPAWQKEATKKLLSSIQINQSENDPILEHSLNMLRWVQSYQALKMADSLVFQKFFATGHAGPYFLARLIDQRMPLDERISARLIGKSKKLAADFFNKSDSIPESIAFDILLLKKEYELLNTFLETYVNQEGLSNDFIGISNVTISKYNHYPEDLQELMVDLFQKVLAAKSVSISSFEKSTILEFLKNKLPCAQLRELVNLHKEDLLYFTMPDDCL